MFGPLLPRQEYTLGFPWRRPVCERPDLLTRTEAALCANYEFSDSLYEEVIGFFTLKGAAPNQNSGYAALEEMRICAPSDVGFGALVTQDVEMTAFNLLRVDNINQCFNLLIAGDIDAAMGDVVSAVDTLDARGDGDLIEEAPWLGVISTVHAIALRDNAAGMAALSGLNEGLSEIKSSGEWFALIEKYLASR